MAGETFTDHPRSVSHTIGAFLRLYNDRVDDRRRQDLYAVAANVVGTSAAWDVEQARIAKLVDYGEHAWRRRKARSWLAHLRHRMEPSDRSTPTAAARYVVHALGAIDDETHASVLALVDALIDVGRCGDVGAAPGAALVDPLCFGGVEGSRPGHGPAPRASI